MLNFKLKEEKHKNNFIDLRDDSDTNTNTMKNNIRNINGNLCDNNDIAKFLLNSENDEIIAYYQNFWVRKFWHVMSKGLKTV